jgi:hypothetical protein
MRLVAWDLLHWEISHIKGRVISSCLLASCAWNLIVEMIVLLFSHVEKIKVWKVHRLWPALNLCEMRSYFLCKTGPMRMALHLFAYLWFYLFILLLSFFFYLVCKFFSPALILVDLSTWFYAFSLGWELKKAIWIAVHMTFLWCFNMWVSEVQHVWLLFFIWRTKWQLLLVR